MVELIGDEHAPFAVDGQVAGTVEDLPPHLRFVAVQRLPVGVHFADAVNEVPTPTVADDVTAERRFDDVPRFPDEDRQLDALDAGGALVEYVDDGHGPVVAQQQHPAALGNGDGRQVRGARQPQGDAIVVAGEPPLCRLRLDLPDAAVLFGGVDGGRLLVDGNVSAVSDLREPERLQPDDGVSLVDVEGVRQQNGVEVVQYDHPVYAALCRRDSSSANDAHRNRRIFLYK